MYRRWHCRVTERGPTKLQRSVALYRLAFGQPRQDDLLAYLSGQIDPADFERLVDDLRIDLGPRAFE